MGASASIDASEQQERNLFDRIVEQYNITMNHNNDENDLYESNSFSIEDVDTVDNKKDEDHSLLNQDNFISVSIQDSQSDMVLYDSVNQLVERWKEEIRIIKTPFLDLESAIDQAFSYNQTPLRIR